MTQPQPEDDLSLSPSWSPSRDPRLAAAFGEVPRQIRSYLAEVLAGFNGTPPLPLGAPSLPVSGEEALAHEIFSVITSRTYCYLGRTKAEAYRADVVASLRRRMETGGPFRFFYDIGPGYHATTRPGLLPLRFDVGLSELLILSQVNSLCRRLAELYEPGARFYLVIDNLCGLRTNDVPLFRTKAYVRDLRRLIAELRLSDTVSLLVESEEFALADYDRLLADVEVRPAAGDPSPAEIDNVARFLGRSCTAAEAAERIARYRRTGSVTDRLVDTLVREVHMTQRATGATLGFRPFPGGDQRTQAGELGLLRSFQGRIRPLLLTSRNANAYDCVRLDISDMLPPPMTQVAFASLRSAEPFPEASKKS